jgi:hypothetical protein
MFTRGLHWSLSWASWIQPTPSHLICLTFMLRNINLSPATRHPNWFSLHACRLTRSSHPPWFYRHNEKLLWRSCCLTSWGFGCPQHSHHYQNVRPTPLLSYETLICAVWRHLSSWVRRGASWAGFEIGHGMTARSCAPIADGEICPSSVATFQ